MGCYRFDGHDFRLDNREIVMKKNQTNQTVKSSKSGRRRYDEELKRQVLNLLLTGHSVSEIAQDFGIHANILYKWKKEARPQQTETEAEMERLRQRLRQVETERDILKKALAVFSRQT